MAEQGILGGWISAAKAGLQSLFEKANKAISTNNLKNYVRELRQIPSSDREKKAELARFFQTDYGDRFSTEERKQAYDDLLGVERNKRTHS